MSHIFYLFFLLTPFLTFAQSNKVTKHNKAKYFEPQSALNAEDFVNTYFDELGLEKPEDLTSPRKFVSKNGWVRNRFKQKYRGLEVLGSSIVLHEKNGSIEKMTGNIFPDIALNINPSQSTSAIEHELINYIWQNSPESTSELIAIKEDFQIESMELKVMDRMYPSFSGYYKLVYEVIARRNIPKYDRISYFLDANTGELLSQMSHVCSISVEGEANTKYYGTQKIITDSIAPNKFVLFDETRDIVTLNAKESRRFDINDYDDFEDEDNYWDNANEDMDEIAGDLHYCSAAYHDYMNETFGWKGVDGLGAETSQLIGIAHINDQFYLNAFWDGVATHYGNGLCVDYGPLTTLDVVGHEYAHGFTQFSSGLIYRNESGALNEATSDIFGKALEHAYDPDNFNWLIGDRFTSGEGEAFRNMSNPNDKDHPQYYKGENWSSFGAVHTNSGVYNFWYYLLVEGGTGVNEGGYFYNVPSIGWEDATDIVFGAQVGYFEPSTGYQDAFNYTLSYVTDAFGANSEQYAAVEEAWRAVGVSPSESGPAVGGAVQVDGTATTICTDECIDITLDLVNLGSEPIETGTRIDLRYLLDNDITTEEILILDQNLNVGDTLVFTFERQLCWFDINGGQEYMVVEYSVDEGANYSELDYDFINLNDGAPFDIELTRFDLTNNVCSSNFFSLQYRFENQGCDIIPAGTQYEITITVDGNAQKETYFLNSDARPSVGFIFITSFNFTIPTGFNNDYTVELSFTEDPNLDNNSLDGSFQTFEIMRENQVERFTNYSTDFSKWVYSEDFFFIFSRALFFQSSERLFLGSTNSYFELNEPAKCVKPEDFFVSTSFANKNRLNICYDTEDMQDPVLRFKYIPFYSSVVPGLTPEFTAMHQVYASNSFEPLPLQIGFPEGVEQLLTYDLPPGSGELVIETLCMYGDEFAVNNGDLSTGDYQLFDNIRIEERGTVSTKEDLFAQDISVYPNPASEQIQFIDDKKRDFKLTVFSVDGKQIHTQQVSNGRHIWAIDKTQKGLFIYNMQFQNGETTSGKFIIQN